jgi:hypothetical protein
LWVISDRNFLLYFCEFKNGKQLILISLYRRIWHREVRTVGKLNFYEMRYQKVIYKGDLLANHHSSRWFEKYPWQINVHQLMKHIQYIIFIFIKKGVKLEREIQLIILKACLR